jgi:Fe-S cluster biogenesis protein NfuA
MDLKARVERILTDEVAPFLELDAGAIEVLGVDGGVVQLRLGGACAGCPSSIMTVVMGLEQELRKRIPEVEYLEAVP